MSTARRETPCYRALQPREMSHLAPGRASPCRRGAAPGRARRARPARARRRRRSGSPSRSRSAAPVSPSGRPATARICCSNCETAQAASVQWPGIVDARRDLVGEQRAVGQHEELDADDADIVERLEDGEGGGARACGGCRPKSRPARSRYAGCRRDGRFRPDRRPRARRRCARAAMTEISRSNGTNASRMSGTPPIAA